MHRVRFARIARRLSCGATEDAPLATREAQPGAPDYRRLDLRGKARWLPREDVQRQPIDRQSNAAVMPGPRLRPEGRPAWRITYWRTAPTRIALMQSSPGPSPTSMRLGTTSTRRIMRCFLSERNCLNATSVAFSCLGVPATRKRQRPSKRDGRSITWLAECRGQIHRERGDERGGQEIPGSNLALGGVQHSSVRASTQPGKVEQAAAARRALRTPRRASARECARWRATDSDLSDRPRCSS